MPLTAAEVFRDYETDGVPASGPHQVEKADVRSWGAALEGTLPTAMPVPYVVGDILYAANTTTLDKVTAVAAGQPLISKGVGTKPDYAGSFVYFDSANVRMQLKRDSSSWTPAGTTSIHIMGPNTGGEARDERTAVSADSVSVYGRLNGTFAAPTHLLSGDQIMGLIGVGIDTDGTFTMQQGPSIGIYTTQIWTATHHGSGFQLYGINDDTTALVNNLMLKNQKAGFGTESDPKYGLTFSKNAATGITDPFGNDGLGLIGADGGNISANLQTFGSNYPFVNLFRAAGTKASKTALSSADIIGGVYGWGYAGATSLYNGGAGIQFVANQAFSTGNAGTRAEILTTANASVSSAVAATFYGSKSLYVGASPSDPGAGMMAAQNGTKFPSFTFGTLPAGVTGQTVWCSNARAVNTTSGVQEGAAAGTGALVTYNGSAWKLAGSNVTAAA